MPTQQPAQHSRINLDDIISQIEKKLGPERTQRYLCYVNQLLAEKLSKRDFTKSCFLVLGRENISLHNKLIYSILKNAFHETTPPPVGVESAATKSIGAVGSKSAQPARVFHHLATPSQTDAVWSNGNILPPSPRKVKSCIPDRRFKDRPSPLRQHGRKDATYVLASAPLDENVFRENGTLCPYDLKRPMQHHQGHAPLQQAAKKPRTEYLAPHDRAFEERKGMSEVVVMEDAEELQRADILNCMKPPLQAPVGIPLCPASIGGSRKSCCLVKTTSSYSHSSNYYHEELCDTEALRRRMEKIAETHGLGGVTLDCSNLLNNALHAYLKRLIRSGVELLGIRFGHYQSNHPVLRNQSQLKQISGVQPGNHMHGQSSVGTLNHAQQWKQRKVVSLQDFRVAMELNPLQIGEDWPLQLEKICLRSYEE